MSSNACRDKAIVWQSFFVTAAMLRGVASEIALHSGRIAQLAARRYRDYRAIGSGVDATSLRRSGAAELHLDIMDGHFVDSISFGPAVVATVRKHTKLPLDVHLMIEHADHYVPRFLEAGANSMTVHVEPEAKHDVAQTLSAIRTAGCGAGLSLN